MASKPILVTSGYSTALKGETPDELMYFPAGTHKVKANVNGQPRQVSVTVSSQTASVLQADLEQLLLQSVEPFIDFNHRCEESAAIPKSFSWKEGEGVMLNLEWTSAGKSAVEGKTYRYFSPTFLLSETGVPSGLPETGPVGALTNNPAFRSIKRIAANYGAECSTEQGDTMTEQEEVALRSELETVRAENKQLKESAGLEKVEASHKAQIDVIKAQLETVQSENKTLREAAETLKVEAANREADSLIEAAVRDRKIGPKNETLKTNIKGYILVNPEGGKALLESMPPDPAFKTVINVNASDKDLGRASAPKDTTQMSSNTGKLCESAVKEYQASHPGVTWDAAWKIQASLKPEIFAGAN